MGREGEQFRKRSYQSRRERETEGEKGIFQIQWWVNDLPRTMGYKNQNSSRMGTLMEDSHVKILLSCVVPLDKKRMRTRMKKKLWSSPKNQSGKLKLAKKKWKWHTCIRFRSWKNLAVNGSRFKKMRRKTFRREKGFSFRSFLTLPLRARHRNQDSAHFPSWIHDKFSKIYSANILACLL